MGIQRPNIVFDQALWLKAADTWEYFKNITWWILLCVWLCSISWFSKKTHYENILTADKEEQVLQQVKF